MVTRSAPRRRAMVAQSIAVLPRADHDDLLANCKWFGSDLAVLNIFEAIQDVFFAGDIEMRRASKAPR